MSKPKNDFAMPLKQQVTSLELSKRLRELGVPQKSLWYWSNQKTSGWILLEQSGGWGGHSLECISAFTVAELGIYFKNISWDSVRWSLSAGDSLWPLLSDDWWMFNPDNLAKMLIHLIEKKIVTP